MIFTSHSTSECALLRALCMAVLLALLSGRMILAAEETAEEPPKIANPAFTPPDRSFFAEGRFVYEQYCIVCHGARGDGQGEMAPSLTVKPRSFRSGVFKYRSTPWGKLPTTADLISTIRNGRTGTAMGMFSYLTEEQIRSVAEYVKSFSRKWRQPENYAAPVPIPPAPVWLYENAELQKHAGEGRRVFATACASCHGENADGKSAVASYLKDEWGTPCPPADLRAPHFRTGDEPSDLFRVLATGLNGTPMPSFAEALTDEQKWDVIAYLKTIRESEDARHP